MRPGRVVLPLRIFAYARALVIHACPSVHPVPPCTAPLAPAIPLQPTGQLVGAGAAELEAALAASRCARGASRCQLTRGRARSVHHDAHLDARPNACWRAPAAARLPAIIRPRASCATRAPRANAPIPVFQESKTPAGGAMIQSGLKLQRGEGLAAAVGDAAQRDWRRAATALLLACIALLALLGAQHNMSLRRVRGAGAGRPVVGRWLGGYCAVPPTPCPRPSHPPSNSHCMARTNPTSSSLA